MTDEPVEPDSSAPVVPPLLLGTYNPKIDAKGRMAIPAKMRAQLGEGMVMARGQERCVYLLPQSSAASPHRFSASRWATRRHVSICACFSAARLIRTPTSRGVWWCRRCCASMRISVTTLW